MHSFLQPVLAHESSVLSPHISHFAGLRGAPQLHPEILELFS